MVSKVPLIPTPIHSSVGAVAASVETVVQAITPAIQPGVDPITLAIQTPIDAVTSAIQRGVNPITLALQAVGHGFVAVLPCALRPSIIFGFNTVAFSVQTFIEPVTLAIQPPVKAVTPAIQPSIKSIALAIKTVFSPLLPLLSVFQSLFRSHVLPARTHFLSLLRGHLLPPLSQLPALFRVHLIRVICQTELRQCPPQTHQAAQCNQCQLFHSIYLLSKENIFEASTL
jgi:hypothetical protein